MAEHPSLFDAAEPLSVGELTTQIQDVIEGTFTQVWVVGEISNWKPASSGHIYFNLKDDASLIRGIVWRSLASRLKTPLRDGIQVEIRGKITVYKPRGDYSLVVDQIAPRGAGAQDLALRLLKEKLLKLGYFAPERKKPLPKFPRRLALVTSPTGAAIRDMLEILARRWHLAEVLVCPVRVQGAGAVEDIVAALDLLNRSPGVEVILLGRGGGSSDDLAAFNEEAVARAIFASRVPIVSAVGHEIDLTIADLVADRRALTPSEAAEIATPHRDELARALGHTLARMTESLQTRLRYAGQRLDEIAQRRVLRLPLERFHELERKLDDWSERMRRAGLRKCQVSQDRIAALAARLESVSPLNVLGRGYSLTRTEPEHRLVRGIGDVKPNDAVEILLQDGRLLGRIERIEPKDARQDS